MATTILDPDSPQILPFPRQTQSNPDPTRNQPFFGRLESLRAIAAMAVAGYHVSGCVLHNILLLPAVPWQGVGLAQNTFGKVGLVLLPAHAALMVFFVLSGFVLRLSLGHGPQRLPIASAKFLLGRAFRMYPIVFFAMTLTVALSFWGAYPPALFGRPLTLSLFLKNLLLLDVSINVTLWALQVELLMAPLIALLYFIEHNYGPRLLLHAAIVTTILAYIPSWAFWPPLSTNMFAFILGMTIPTFGRRLVSGLSKRWATMWTLITCCMLFLTAPCLGLFSRNSAVLEAYASTMLISLIAYRPDIQMLSYLDWKPLRLAGLCSGSYYVLHLSTVPMTLAIAATIVPHTWSTCFPALTGCLVIGVWLVALVPLAIASFHIIEAKGIMLGKHVVRLCHFDPAPVVRGPFRQQWASRRAA